MPTANAVTAAMARPHGVVLKVSTNSFWAAFALVMLPVRVL